MNHLATLPSAAAAAPREPSERPELQIRWARHQDEVRAAQRLRYIVFHQEWRAQQPPCAHGQQQPDCPVVELDIDEFDDHCEHLIVSAPADEDHPAEVVGTYRVLLPDAARRLGHYYTENEFDLSSLHGVRPTLGELGRSCIAPSWRTGGVILMLWSHLCRFLVVNGVERAIGCASIPILDGGVNAARVWNELRHTHLAASHWRVTPHVPLPVDLLTSSGAAEWPALVKGYVKVGAQVLGAPAWDSAFGCADLPMMLDFQAMSPAYRRRFLGA